MVFHVVVIVLGDLGRSPRMQYHASSLSRLEGVDMVTLIGYDGENILSDLRTHPKIKEKRLQIIHLHWARKISSLLHAILKGMILIIHVFKALMDVSPYDLIIVQNPPCLPALIAVALLNILFVMQTRSKIILDWHNLGYSMFASYKPSPLTSGNETVNELPIEPTEQSLLVRFARLSESFFTQLLSDYQICVSKAMKKYLEIKYRAKNVMVLYDRPLKKYSTTSSADDIKHRHDLLLRYGLTDDGIEYASSRQSSLEERKSESNYISNNTILNHTIQTKCITNSASITFDACSYEIRKDKHFVIITSTSWTPDEDFDMLLEAILQIDSCLHQNISSSNYRKVTVIITGKGPLRDGFERKICELEQSNQLIHVKVKCLWLTSSDYFDLLSYADIGVCLHTSTSGLDLPMKVLDMLGAGLVILAARYYAISELIRHNDNGILYCGSRDLTNNILRLMSFNVEDSVAMATIHSSKQSSTTTNIDNKMDNDVDSSTSTSTSSDSGSAKTVESMELKILRHNVREDKIIDWYENWDTVMKPVMEEIISNPVTKGVGYHYIYLISMLSMILLLLAYLSNHITHTKKFTSDMI